MLVIVDEPGPGSANPREFVVDEDEVGLTIAVDVGDGVSAGECGVGRGEGVPGVQDEAGRCGDGGGGGKASLAVAELDGEACGVVRTGGVGDEVGDAVTSIEPFKWETGC